MTLSNLHACELLRNNKAESRREQGRLAGLYPTGVSQKGWQFLPRWPLHPGRPRLAKLNHDIHTRVLVCHQEVPPITEV